MNLYDNIPNFNGPIQQPGINPIMNNNPMLNPPMINNNNLTHKINELELRIKKIEQRLSLLETNTTNHNYQEPEATIRTRLSRARNKLKKFIEGGV